MIPRGIIYHRIVDDLKWLVLALFSRLDDQSLVSKFEYAFAKLIGKRYCLAFPFARTAIYFALKSRNLPSGAEVIMPPISIKGILDVVMALGLKPVFVDLHPDTLCFDEDALERSITKDTRAILITYLFGIVPNVEKLVETARAHNLFVIEDFSQCLNGKFNGKKVGGFGDVGVYSASSIKTLDTYGGGLLVCDDEAIAQALAEEQKNLAPPIRTALLHKIFTDLIRNVATTRMVFSFIVFPLLKLLDYFVPGSFVKQTGDRNKGMITSMPSEWFARYTSLQAKAGLEFLKTLDRSDAERVGNVRHIKAAVSTDALTFPSGATGGDNIYWQLIGYFANPSSVQLKMQKQGVDTARSSLLQISDLKAYPYQGHTPNASRLYNSGYFVPSYPGLTDADRARIVKALNSL